MMKIDRLGAEAQSMIKNFPEINAVAQAHRNFVAVETMQGNIDRFQFELGQVKELLKRDEEEINRQPHLLNIHHAISRLRNIKEDAMEQITRVDDSGLEDALLKAFDGLDEAVDEFDEHVGEICVNLLRLLEYGGESLIVKLAIVIEEEEKFDTRTKELQEAQREFKGLATNFKTLAAGVRELRGYKDKMLGCIRQHFEENLATTKELFQENPDGLVKSLAWYFNELNAVKIGMSPLMPKKWKIFRTYTQIYHQGVCQWLEDVAKDPEIAPIHMLAIIHAKDKYLQKMSRLGARDEDLQPSLPGGRDSDLMREYRQLIITKLDQWMTQLNKNDQQAFLNRDESAIDRDEQDRLRTKSLGDMWRIFREQLIVASAANLHEVTEGVCDAIFRAIKIRLNLWSELTSNALTFHARTSGSGRESVSRDTIPVLHDWLVALANDQLAIIDDEEGHATGHIGFMTAFHLQLIPLVGAEYRAMVVDKINSLQGELTDLGFRCIKIFAQIVVAVDFKSVMEEFFTSAWYSARPGTGMGAIILTFEDYLHDYRPTLINILHDLLVTELAKALLQAYVGAVRNKGAKFRTNDGYMMLMQKDREVVTNFFETYKGYEDRSTFVEIATSLDIFDHLLWLLHAPKDADHLIDGFDRFRSIYWDVKIGWVEALLRCRDDMDFSPIGDGRRTMKAVRQYALRDKPEGPDPSLMDPVD